MASLRDVLKRLFLRPDVELPEWAILQKYSRRSLDTIVREMRSALSECRSRAVPYRAAAPAETRAQRHQRARAVFAQSPELSFETVARGTRLGYSEDTMLGLRSAAIGELIRSGRSR